MIAATSMDCDSVFMPTWRGFLYMLLTQFVISAAIVLLLVPLGGGWKGFALNFFYGLAYANCIGWPAWLVMPYVGMRAGHMKPLRRWGTLLVSITIITIVGSLLAVAVLASFGFFPWARYWTRFWGSLQLAMVVAFLCGIGFFLYESLRYRLRYDAAQARLSSLESRIQPHFLFNTLNSISALIPDDPAAAERMTERLAALLRFSLDSTHQRTVPLESELKVAVDYLEIQKTRFGERLQYSIDVPANLMQLQVPPFSLQTLLENSVKYGGGEIRITANERTLESVHLKNSRNGRTLHGRLILEVWDSGEGFATHAIKSGHGLDNLRSRLAILWGGAALLEVLSENSGCRVRISMPRATSP